MLRLRVASAAIAIPPLAFVVYVGGLPFALFVAALATIAAYELCRILDRGAVKPFAPLAIIAAPLYVLDAYWPAVGIGRLVLAATLVFGLTRSVVRPTEPTNAIASWALTVAIPLYTGWLISFFILLRSIESGGSFALPGQLLLSPGIIWTALALFSTWTCDTVAYLFGRAFGRRPLHPPVSPNKTREGTLAGLVAASLVGVLWSPAVGITLLAGLALGAVAGVSAIVGDLAESLLKRAGGVKDASRLFPGHGGLLDRLDSLLFVAVMVYYTRALVVGA